MSNTDDQDAPRPGTAAYDAMMVEKYHRQMHAGDKQPTGSPESEFREVTTAAGGTFYVHRTDARGTATDWTEDAAREASDPGQLRMIDADIRRIETELAETAGHDPATGAPAPRYQGEQRRTRELTLAQLRYERPIVAAQIQEAKAWLDANVPTQEQKLQAEHARRAATEQRAQQIADEAEAQELAERILQQRRSGLGIR